MHDYDTLHELLQRYTDALEQDNPQFQGLQDQFNSDLATAKEEGLLEHSYEARLVLGRYGPYWKTVNVG